MLLDVDKLANLGVKNKKYLNKLAKLKKEAEKKQKKNKKQKKSEL